MAAEKVRIYDQNGKTKKKGISPLIWLLLLLLVLGVIAYFYVGGRSR